MYGFKNVKDDDEFYNKDLFTAQLNIKLRQDHREKKNPYLTMVIGSK